MIKELSYDSSFLSRNIRYFDIIEEILFEYNL